VLASLCTATCTFIAAPAAFAAGSGTVCTSLLLLLHLLLPLPLLRCEGADHAADSLAGAVLLRRL
jgi:hypothetical protein